jgi:hypothetical protein
MTAPAPVEKKPVYRRWWFIALAVVLGIGVIGSIGGDGTDPGSESTTTVAAGEGSDTPEVPSTTAVDTTTTRPTTTTTQATTTTVAAWSSFTVEGRGDDVIDLAVPGDAAAVLEFTHSGSSNFAVTSYTAGGGRVDLLVNEIGSYRGARPVNFLDGEEVAELEIIADGAWTVTARPLGESPTMVDRFDGSGDEVILYLGSGWRLSAANTGTSNFVIRAWSATGRDLLVNEIGSYQGTVRIDPNTVVIEVIADGGLDPRSSVKGVGMRTARRGVSHPTGILPSCPASTPRPATSTCSPSSRAGSRSPRTSPPWSRSCAGGAG